MIVLSKLVCSCIGKSCRSSIQHVTFNTCQREYWLLFIITQEALHHAITMVIVRQALVQNRLQDTRVILPYYTEISFPWYIFHLYLLNFLPFLPIYLHKDQDISHQVETRHIVQDAVKGHTKIKVGQLHVNYVIPDMVRMRYLIILFLFVCGSLTKLRIEYMTHKWVHIRFFC